MIRLTIVFLFALLSLLASVNPRIRLPPKTWTPASGSTVPVLACSSIGALSSVLGHGEWVMNQRNIQVPEYRRLINIFNPISF